MGIDKKEREWECCGGGGRRLASGPHVQSKWPLTHQIRGQVMFNAFCQWLTLLLVHFTLGTKIGGFPVMTTQLWWFYALHLHLQFLIEKNS